MAGLDLHDGLALGWFLAVWALFAWIVERSPWSRRSLSVAMNRERAAWIRTLAARDLRMIDTAIMTGLQNGTAFFASTSLLAIGGCFAILDASDRIVEVVRDLPLVTTSPTGVYEVKVLGLMLIYAYAFFKFGWAYRLFNYALILIGAVPSRDALGTPRMEEAVDRATRMTVIAGRHFNRGLRAFFMSVGYLGWFFGPAPLVVTSGLVILVLVRRQFLSDSRAAVVEETRS